MTVNFVLSMLFLHCVIIVSVMCVCDSLAGRLKNLFLEFAAYFFQHAVELLDKLNSSKSPGQ